jgi:phage terminase Nu1 subunit (DNA packaging protein)
MKLKPKIPPVPEDGDLPQFELNKRLTAAKIKETQSREHAQRTREKTLRMQLAVARGELVTHQAAFIFTAIRQKLLAVPQAYSRQLLNISDRHVMVERLTAIMHEQLKDLADFPRKVIDPNWLQSLDDEES